MVDKANFFAQRASAAVSSGTVNNPFERPIDFTRAERQQKAKTKALFNFAKVRESEIESETTPSDLPEDATREFTWD